MHPGSDIDTLFIGPPQVTREAFFAQFSESLRTKAQYLGVTKCVPILDAYTPIIKLKMRDVSIDLLFAQLAEPLGEGLNAQEVMQSDEIVNNTDEKSVRCINGYRVANKILQLVPNHENFRKTLRFVKWWARSRGIYSNVLGFCGGITWALLVARVCQLYSCLTPSQLVACFFHVFSEWNWSYEKPVMLCEIDQPQSKPGLSGLLIKAHIPFHLLVFIY